MNQNRPGGFALNRLLDYASRLRFPKLLALTAFLFVADLVVPDAIPFIDEILLGLTAALLAVLKRGRSDNPKESGDSDL